MPHCGKRGFGRRTATDRLSRRHAAVAGRWQSGVEGEIDKARGQQERIATWTGEARPVPIESTALDRHVNRAAELVREDTQPRYVFYAPDQSGLIYISKVPPPGGVAAFVLVDGKAYPRIIRR